jgi:hypothetical protein
MTTSRSSLVLWGALAGAVLGAAASGNARADTDEQAPTPKACLYQNELRNTKVLDDRTILFETRDGQAYSNTLPQQCPTLRPNSILNYSVDGSRICSGSMFQVLMNFGFGQTPTFVCPLGMFVPISPGEAKELVARSQDSRDNPRRRRRSERDMVHIEPVTPLQPPQ